MTNPRSTVPGLVHHVIAQFVDRRFLINDDTARERYLALLGRAMTTSDWRCLAYAIMSSHLHLAMIAGESPPERWMRRVHPPFSRWLNEHQHGLGHVWAERCDMWAVAPGREAPLIAYLHNNPVRAGVVEHARDSTWTSHRAYVGLATVPRWLHVDEGLARCEIARTEFDGAVISDHRAVDRPDVAGIHRAARVHGAIEIGTPIAGPNVEAPVLVRRFTHLRPTPARVIEVLAETLGLKASGYLSRGRGAVGPRAIAIQAARELGMAIASIAVALGITPQAGSRLASRDLDEVQRAYVVLIAARLRNEMIERGSKGAKRESVYR